MCKGEDVGKAREIDEMGERELVLVVSVRWAKDETDTWKTMVLETQRCAMLSFAALEPIVFAW